MAFDPKARKMSVGFPGGSLTATVGLLEALFGTELVSPEEPSTAQVSVDSHTRVRVIGGPATAVAGHTYDRKKYPTGQFNGGSGGEAIRFQLNGSDWTARLSGSHQDFNDWLVTKPGNGTAPIYWRSEKGVPYGPFAQV
jgi:hypothetical protein